MKLAEDIEKWLYLLPCANTRLGQSERDEHRRLQKVGVRWYNPLVGRFLQQDPAFSTPFYSFCKNDPVDLNDAFTTADEAGIAAIAEVWWKSKSQGVEYGGWIYWNPDGTFSYTDPVKGTNEEVFLGEPPANVIGHYHTHVEVPYFIDLSSWWMNMSSPTPGDILVGLSYRHFFTGQPSIGYLGTPNGTIHRFVFNEGSRTIGFFP